MIKKEWLPETILFVLLILLLAACGTLEVGVEPGLTATSAETVEQVSSTPPATTEPLVATVPVATPELSPPSPSAETPATDPALAGQPSGLWATYRDPDQGYGYAYPCFWSNDHTTLSSYDEYFALDHTIRGQWIDNQPPAGVVKIDTGILDYAEYGLSPDLSLGEAITAAAGDPYGDGRPQFESIEETTLYGKPVQRVYLGEQQDSWGGDFQRDIYYFPIEPGRYFRLFVLPTEQINNPSVQGIVDSLVLSAGELITIPTYDPSPPVEGRAFYTNDEAGTCFQYPAEYDLEEYDTGGGSNLGPTVSLTLERPLYTVGLTALTQKVGQEPTLEDAVDNFLLSFSEQAAAGIRRNPSELVAGIDYRLGDQPAQALDGVPGPVNSLDVFTRYEDKLFQVVFSPSPFDNPQASADIWLLYNVVTSSFSFLP